MTTFYLFNSLKNLVRYIFVTNQETEAKKTNFGETSKQIGFNACVFSMRLPFLSYSYFNHEN